MKRFLFIFLGLVFLMIPVLAQDGEVPEIPDVQYLIANFGVLMLTFTGVAAVSSFVAEFLIRLVKTTSKVVKIVFVLVLGVGLTFLSGLVFKEGDYALMLWWQKIFWGLLSGAAAAGLRGANLLFVKSVVEFLIGLILSKEPDE
jgi:hypothetical protein